MLNLNQQERLNDHFKFIFGLTGAQRESMENFDDSFMSVASGFEGEQPSFDEKTFMNFMKAAEG